jgi:hypothetical protein
MFLGSGAFGEVFEGLAIDITDDNRQFTKVAVKVSIVAVVKKCLQV